ncbi:MAG: glycosyltransferase family 4 protein [Cyanobacteria bacterium P01_A01_bin.84]
MNIVHLWKSDSPSFAGGGAVSMYRLHSVLREVGVDSRILCRMKTIDSPYVQEIKRGLKSKILEKLLKQLTSKILSLNDIHLIYSLNIKQHEFYVNSDVLHVHGTHSEFLNYLTLPTLTKNKPTVFTLKDMWALTGHCGYSYDCERWKIGCGQCPYPETHPPIKRDSTRLEWKLKDWVYRQLNLSLICPSQWLTDLAKQSPLLNRFPIHHIPHGIETEIFQPFEKQESRLQLGIPLDKKVLLFAAVDFGDYRKGGDLLVEALKSLPASLKSDTILLVFGKETKELMEPDTFSMPVYHLGYLSDKHTKALAYSAADLFLFPSRADNFPNVALESLACSTPVVSFAVGGIPEQVRPGITGYLAQPENINDFCQGITHLLDEEELRNQMKRNCRAIATKEYRLDLYAQRHIELYESLWGSPTSNPLPVMV